MHMHFLHYNIFLEVSMLVNVAFSLSMASCPMALILECPPLSHYLLISFFHYSVQTLLVNIFYKLNQRCHIFRKITLTLKIISPILDDVNVLK